MSVHKEISSHVNKQNKIIKEFFALDQKREQLIDEALQLCQQGLPFTTDKINEVTKEMNEISKLLENIPSRKLVTPQMVQEYAEKLKK
ncbi:YpbS family protein [Bacillus sp. 31A1R]|uniref:YpbS family protein n=1 Tax=Robertmurraya mangrovi TaxID=3098077 RepID=A0ABU5J395_9BACI|nr:YpbS family protein [Bacillus sp. 31A1R]MDZ5473873.1 YpbS family protein [Bacillus sp. 31A1R]